MLFIFYFILFYFIMYSISKQEFIEVYKKLFNLEHFRIASPINGDGISFIHLIFYLIFFYYSFSSKLSYFS